jgi:hypothetical protein
MKIIKYFFFPSLTIFLTFLTSLAVLSAYAQVPSYVPVNGLVAYWPFDGNANDISGNGNNGTVNGATLAEDRFGSADKAYSFYGANDYIEISTNNGSFDSQTYTVSYWYKTNSVPYVGFYARAIISRSNGSGSPSNVYDNFSIFEGGGTISLNYQGVGTPFNSPSGIDWLTQVNNDSWHLLNVTVNSDSLKAYVDGILVNAQPFIAGISFQNYSLRFGKSNHSYWSEYNGILDDIGIWSRALTQEEITNLYNSCVPSLYYSDNDGDSFGAGDGISTCTPPAGYVLNNTDCNDANGNQNEGVSEICNNQDDNCNSLVDEGLTFQNYYTDADFDGFGTEVAQSSCIDLGAGYTLNNTDCDDSNAAINPNAEDIAGNGIDENCDGQIDNSILELNSTIALYPNPTSSELNIQINSSIIGNDLYILDAVGKIVYKQQLLSTQTTIPVSNFADGNYVLRVGEVVKRVVVQK